MAQSAHPFMGKVFVGGPAPIGKMAERYDPILLDGEAVEMEFFGVRDGMVFTDRRIIVMNAQGITGRKLGMASFAWRAITAFSVENSGTFDLDAEFKFCGSGWGVCEVQFTKGTDIRPIARLVNDKVFARA